MMHAQKNIKLLASCHVMSGSLSASNNLATTGRAFIKFGFRKVFENLSRKFKFS